MPRRRIVASIVAAVLFAGSLADPVFAEWRRIDSPNFVVVGDVSAGELREIARRFESFREVLARVLTERFIASAVPTVVVVFPSDRAFTPFKPKFNGKTIELSGLFLPRRDVNYIAMVRDWDEDTMRVVFHEYSHLITSNIAGNVPVWLNEGLAEFYSTFQLVGDREAMIGRPVPGHLQRLNQHALLSLEELLNVKHDSPLYNEGDRRSIFYAQSWALTHLLLVSQPPRRDKLGAYVASVDDGAPPLEAWQRAFAADRIDRELQNYIRRSISTCSGSGSPTRRRRLMERRCRWRPRMPRRSSLICSCSSSVRTKRSNGWTARLRRRPDGRPSSAPASPRRGTTRRGQRRRCSAFRPVRTG